MPLTIESVDRSNGKAILVGFSDGTVATFSVEELAEMRRFRSTPKEDIAPPQTDKALKFRKFGSLS